MTKYLMAILLLSGCALYEKSEGSDEIRSIIQEVIKEKGSPGIVIEIFRLPPNPK